MTASPTQPIDTSQNEETQLSSKHMLRTMDAIRSVLPNNHYVQAAADKADKSQDTTNTFTIISPHNNTILLPCFLKNPGSGYLTFKISPNDTLNSQQQHRMTDQLNQFINTEFYAQHPQHNTLQQLDIKKILYSGLDSIIDHLTLNEYLPRLYFKVDSNIVCPQPSELKALQDDLLQASYNITCELVATAQHQPPKAHNSTADKNIIGRIDTNNLVFPEILARRFVYHIAEYAHLHQIAKLSQINQGYFGVHLNTPLGYQYQQWLYAAMNYTQVKRHLIYLILKQSLEQQFNCSLTLINDTIRNGIFEQSNTGKKLIITTHSTQSAHHLEHTNVNQQSQNAKSPPTDNKGNTQYSHPIPSLDRPLITYITRYSNHFSQTEVAKYIQQAATPTRLT